MEALQGLFELKGSAEVEKEILATREKESSSVFSLLDATLARLSPGEQTAELLASKDIKTLRKMAVKTRLELQRRDNRKEPTQTLLLLRQYILDTALSVRTGPDQGTKKKKKKLKRLPVVAEQSLTQSKVVTDRALSGLYANKAPAKKKRKKGPNSTNAVVNLESCPQCFKLVEDLSAHMNLCKPAATPEMSSEEDEEDMEDVSEVFLDDWDPSRYRVRVVQWYEREKRWTKDYAKALESMEEEDAIKHTNKLAQAACEVADVTLHPEFNSTQTSYSSHSYHTLEGNYRVLRSVYTQLFDYQQESIQWLWDLHCKGTGGILGDEMGLGKTAQIAVFLGGLQSSKLLSRPVLILCPATTIGHWVEELHRWHSPFRVWTLHGSSDAM